MQSNIIAGLTGGDNIYLRVSIVRITSLPLAPPLSPPSSCPSLSPPHRYWGEPFPLVYPIKDEKTGELGEPVALTVDELPLLLPETDNFKPKGVKGKV